MPPRHETHLAWSRRSTETAIGIVFFAIAVLAVRAGISGLGPRYMGRDGFVASSLPLTVIVPVVATAAAALQITAATRRWSRTTWLVGVALWVLCAVVFVVVPLDGDRGGDVMPGGAQTGS